jgi:hypothetical protein
MKSRAAPAIYNYSRGLPCRGNCIFHGTDIVRRYEDFGLSQSRSQTVHAKCLSRESEDREFAMQFLLIGVVVAGAPISSRFDLLGPLSNCGGANKD